ncbi:hypothetical protein P4C99_21970 [Pontiellaceae bacterium B1224]|nr:hypothetical protein [Pontiellaceae bacterium B1224]
MKLSSSVIIKVLKTVADADDQVEFWNDSSAVEIKVASLLIDDDYLSGGSIKNERGIPIKACATGITLGGLEYLEELKTKRFRSSWKGKLLIAISLIASYLFGVMSPVLSDVIKDELKKKNANQQVDPIVTTPVDKVEALRFPPNLEPVVKI